MKVSKNKKEVRRFVSLTGLNSFIFHLLGGTRLRLGWGLGWESPRIFMRCRRLRVNSRGMYRLRRFIGRRKIFMSYLNNQAALKFKSSVKNCNCLLKGRVRQKESTNNWIHLSSTCNNTQHRRKNFILYRIHQYKNNRDYRWRIRKIGNSNHKFTTKMWLI